MDGGWWMDDMRFQILPAVGSRIAQGGLMNRLNNQPDLHHFSQIKKGLNSCQPLKCFRTQPGKSFTNNVRQKHFLNHRLFGMPSDLRFDGVQSYEPVDHP